MEKKLFNRESIKRLLKLIIIQKGRLFGQQLCLHDYFFLLSNGYFYENEENFNINFINSFKDKLIKCTNNIDLKNYEFINLVNNTFYLRLFFSSATLIQKFFLLKIVITNHNYKVASLILDTLEIEVNDVEAKFLNLFIHNERTYIKKILNKKRISSSIIFIIGPNQTVFNYIDNIKNFYVFLNVTSLTFAKKIRDKLKKSKIFFAYNGAFARKYINEISLVSKYCDKIIFKDFPINLINSQIKKNKLVYFNLTEYEKKFFGYSGVNIVPLCILYFLDHYNGVIKLSNINFFLKNNYRSDYKRFFKNDLDFKINFKKMNPFQQFDFIRYLHKIQLLDVDDFILKKISSRKNYASELDKIYS